MLSATTVADSASSNERSVCINVGSCPIACSGLDIRGLADWARVSGDPEADERWRRAAATAEAALPAFDLGYWSAYDAATREPASLHYHRNVHLPQLRILHRLTGREAFARTADRWEGQLSRPGSALRRHLAMRWRGLRRRLGA